MTPAEEQLRSQLDAANREIAELRARISIPPGTRRGNAMTPIEQAAKAHKAEAARWEYIDYRSGDFEIHRDGELKAKGNWRQTPGGQGKCEMERLRDEAAMCAALRALAESL